MAATRDDLAQRRRVEAGRLAHLKRIARRYNDVPPPEVDISLLASELMFKEAHASLEADTLWQLAGWRRDLACLSDSIAVVESELAQSTGLRSRLERRLAALRQNAAATARCIADKEAGMAASRAEVARLLSLVSQGHLVHAKRREAEALRRVLADTEKCKVRLRELTEKLTTVRKEVRGRMRLVNVEAFLARREETV